MTNPRRPRLVYAISDGGWCDTPAGVKTIHWPADHHVTTIHLSNQDLHGTRLGVPAHAGVAVSLYRWAERSMRPLSNAIIWVAEHERLAGRARAPSS